MRTGRPPEKPETRFWKFVKKDGPIHPYDPSLGPCWVWIGTKHFKPNYEYGIFWRGDRRILAHRWVYEFYVGEVSEELVVCHSCDNPSCVNLQHLFAGKPKDNADDRDAKGRQAKGGQIGSAKLSEADVIQIRGRLAAGERQYLIARSFGIDPSAVCNINRGKNWTHVRAAG